MMGKLLTDEELAEIKRHGAIINQYGNIVQSTDPKINPFRQIAEDMDALIGHIKALEEGDA